MPNRGSSTPQMIFHNVKNHAAVGTHSICMMIVYVLECSDGKFYIGQTQNLNRRLKQHKAKSSRAVKYRLPCELIGYMEVSTRSEAVRLERRLKNWKSREAVLKYISRYGARSSLG